MVWTRGEDRLIKGIYRDLDLEGVFKAYEEESYTRLSAMIDDFSGGDRVPKDVFRRCSPDIQEKSIITHHNYHNSSAFPCLELSQAIDPWDELPANLTHRMKRTAGLPSKARPPAPFKKRFASELGAFLDLRWGRRVYHF